METKALNNCNLTKKIAAKLISDKMAAFTFDDFINAANGRETKSESLGKIFKKERPKTKPPLFDPTRPLLAGAAKNTVIGSSLKKIT